MYVWKMMERFKFQDGKSRDFKTHPCMRFHVFHCQTCEHFFNGWPSSLVAIDQNTQRAQHNGLC